MVVVDGGGGGGGGEKGGEGEGEGEGLELRALGRALSAKMMAMPRDGHGSCKAVLQGCLEVLRDLVEIEGPDGSLLEGTELGQVCAALFSCFTVVVLIVEGGRTRGGGGGVGLTFFSSPLELYTFFWDRTT